MKKNIIFIFIFTLVISQDLKSASGDVSDAGKHIGTCLRYTTDKQSCLQCVPHYHLFEGQCYVDINGCKQYIFGNICRSCEAGYILVNNECCDKNCMARIFKSYEVAAEHSELSDDKKIQKRVIEGYGKVVQSLSSFRSQFNKFSLQQTSNQILIGYIRYYIKIIANDKLYRCIADFQIDSKIIFILEFRLETEIDSIKEIIFSQTDIANNEHAKSALQYSSIKFGLKTYGASLERVSVTPYKYGAEFKLIYISTDIAIIINIVVPTTTNKKETPYSPWSEERKDVKEIKALVDKSMTVAKMQNRPQLDIIKQNIVDSNNIQPNQVTIKTIQNPKDNVYKYIYINEQTKQTYEQTVKVNVINKTVDIVENKEIIPKEVQTIKLPESPEKKIITKDQVQQTPEIKEAIKYLEEVQPSLANKEITDAAIEIYGENKKIILIQKKNETITRVVILYNERTNQFKLIDESSIVTTLPTTIIYATTPEGKPKITTTDIEKIKNADNQTKAVLTQIQTQLSFVNISKIVAFEKTEGNLINIYQIVVNGEKPDSPKQQVTLVQNLQTQQIKVINIIEIPTPLFVEPVQRQPFQISETQYNSPDLKSMIEQFKKAKPELKDPKVTIKKAQVEQAKYVNQYIIVIQINDQEIFTIKANKPHEESQPKITNIAPVQSVSSPQTQKTQPEQSYVKKVEVNQVTGVKTTISNKSEDLITSITTQILSTIFSTQSQPKIDQIQSVLRKEYENFVIETSIIKQNATFVQVVVEQNKNTGQIKKINEKIIQPVSTKSQQLILPVTQTTQIASTTFPTVYQYKPQIQSSTTTVVQNNPTLKDQIPIATVVEERGPVQIITYVYENKTTNERNRIVLQYIKEKQTSVIKQITPLPQTIDNINLEKSVTPEGDTKVVSNNIEDIYEEDSNTSKVIEQVASQVPIVKEKPIRYQLISNPVSNTYLITVIEKTTKEIVTVYVNYDKPTKKVTIKDIQKTPNPQLALPAVPSKPTTILSEDDIAQPQVQTIIAYALNTVNTTQIKQIKQIKNTFTTFYEVITQTPEGQKTVTLAINNVNPNDVTLIDISSLIIYAPTVPSVPIMTSPIPSQTISTVDASNVKSTISSDKYLIQSNPYLKLIVNQLNLTFSAINCYFEQKYNDVIQISFIAKPKTDNIMISAYVDTTSRKVTFINMIENFLASSITSLNSCSDIKNSIKVYTSSDLDTISAQQPIIKRLVQQLNGQYTSSTISRVQIFSMKYTWRFVVIINIKTVIYRIVILYNIQNATFTQMEPPVTVTVTYKPSVLQETLSADGTKILTSNSVDQLSTVDKNVDKVLVNLNQTIPIQTSQITNIISKQSTNLNEYIMTVKTSESITTQIKIIYKKDDGSVIVADVKEEPKPLTTFAKPAEIIPKQDYQNSTIQNILSIINSNKTYNISTEKITEINKIVGPIYTTYEFTSKTPTGTDKITIITSPNGTGIVVDYKPIKIIQPIQNPNVKTQYVVNPISGIETLTTNDTKTIKESSPIQSLLTQITKDGTIPPNSEVIYAMTKTTENKVQITTVIKSPEDLQQNVVVVAIVDKTAITKPQVIDKQLVKVQNATTLPEQQTLETTYTSGVISKALNDSKTLQDIVKKINILHPETSKTLPSQIIIQKIGNKTISTITYTNASSIISFDEVTGIIQQIDFAKVPTDIKPLIYETSSNPEGTIISTNTYDKIKGVNRNFNTIISQIKQKIPSIQTEKIEGVKYFKPDFVDAPEKFNIVFGSQKPNQLLQIIIIYNPKNNITTIIDVQSIAIDSISLPVPQKVIPVKLSPEEIQTRNIEGTITNNLKNLPFKEIKTIVTAEEIKNTYTKIYNVQVEDASGNKYAVITEQTGNKSPQVIDYVNISTVRKPQIYTVTTTDSKNGIVSTYTNDPKVMVEEKTYPKVIDAIESKKNLTKNGFIIDSEIIRRYQRTIEFIIRYIKKDAQQINDYRAIVDSRTGHVTINDEVKSNFTNETQLTFKPFEKQYIEFPKWVLADAIKKYSFIQNSLDVLIKADFTFQGKTPQLTQIKQYNNLQNGGINAVEVIMIFQMTVNGVDKKTRVVFLGEQKQTEVEYIMKIIDITTLPNVIPNTITKITQDSLERKIISTTDVQTLKQNNQEYSKILQQISTQNPNLPSNNVINVVIIEMKNANQYNIVYKKEKETIEIKITYLKNAQQLIISDIKSEISKGLFEKMSTKDNQIVQSIVPKEQLELPEYQTIKQQIITQQNLPKDSEIKTVKIEQRPQVDTYTLEMIDSNNTKSTIQVLKNLDNTYTILNIKTEKPPIVPTKEAMIKTAVDPVSGSQILFTNDTKTIKSYTVTQNIVTYLTNTTKTASKNVETVLTFIKTSETKILTILVMPSSPSTPEQRVILAIGDKNNPTNVQILADQMLAIPSFVSNPEQFIKIIRINKYLYPTVITTDKQLKSTITLLQTKYPEFKKVIPQQVVIHKIGNVTITEVTYISKKVTIIISSTQSQPLTIYDESIPNNIKPSKMETIINSDGTKNTITNNVALINSTASELNKILSVPTSPIKKEDIQTVSVKQISSGKIFTITTQSTQDIITKQTTYYINKDSGIVTNMGTEEIPIQQTQPVLTSTTPATKIPETSWNIPTVSQVINKINNTYNPENVTKVQQIQSTPVIKIYQVTVQTTNGTQIIKTAVNPQTNNVQIIEKRPQVILQPVPATEPTLQTAPVPSQTEIKVDQTTGVKTTVTNDDKAIKNDKDIQTTIQNVLEKYPQFLNVAVEQVIKKEYTSIIENKIVYSSSNITNGTTEVITIVNKKDNTTNVLEQAPYKNDIEIPETKLTAAVIPQVESKDDILKSSLKFVKDNYPQLSQSPFSMTIDQLSAITKYTIVYIIQRISYRIVIGYHKKSQKFTVFEEPVEVKKVKPVVLHINKTKNGRTDYYTNDVDTLSYYDKNFVDMLSQLRPQLPLNSSDICGIQSTQTSTGNTYTIIITDPTIKSNIQIEIIYNQKDKTTKIVGLETFPQSQIKPLTQQPQIVDKNDYSNNDIENIIKQSKDQGVPVFTRQQISNIKKTPAIFSTSIIYEIEITFPEEKSLLMVSITNGNTITVISYRVIFSKKSTVSGPSKTTYSVDPATGSQIQSTNDPNIIKNSTVLQNTVSELIRNDVIPKESQIVSAETQANKDTIKSILIIQSNKTTESKVVITIINNQTNQVKILAETPLPKDSSQAKVPAISNAVPSTIITPITFDEVVKKDPILESAVSQVATNHPDVKNTKPTQVVIQKIGTNTIMEITYKNVTVTVVSNNTSGTIKQITSSLITKDPTQKPYILEENALPDGTKTVTSNSIDNIEKVVPTARSAVIEASKIIPIKTEEIKMISYNMAENQYIVVIVDKSSKTKQIKFIYQPDSTKPVQMIDVQEYSQLATPVKPAQIKYEPLNISQSPQIVQAIQSQKIPDEIQSIIKIQKSVTNIVQSYKVEVQVNTVDHAVITFDVNPITKQLTMTDYVKYQPSKKIPEPIVVQQTINPVTQTKQTVFPDKVTYTQDPTYTKVSQYLQDKIPKGYEIVSVVKENYGENQQVSILFKGEDKLPKQIQLNINGFNNEVILLEDKTITPKNTDESAILSEKQPKLTELKLSPIDQQKFEIISKLNNIKESNDFKTIPDLKALEKNDLFMKADTFLKDQYESVLQQSNIIHVSQKKTLDSQEYLVSYVSTRDNNKQIYQAYAKLNPITQTFEINKFSKVGDSKVEKSNLNIDSDIAYGYEPLEKFSSDKNVQFVITQLKKHYSTLDTAVLQSVEVLNLCDKRYNYRIFFKNGLEIVKYIVYFEEAFQRVLFLVGKEFSYGGNYKTLDNEDLMNEGYFRNVDQFVKQKNSDITEGAQVVHVEREDRGNQYGYRVIYAKGGKTYHATSKIGKDDLKVQLTEYSQIIEIPVYQHNHFSPTHNQDVILRINDLTHNSNFEKVHREILSQQGSTLQSAQLIGAIQKSQMFKIVYTVFFIIKQDYYKIKAEIDSTNKQVSINSDLEKISLDSGFTIDNNDPQSQNIIAWAQKNNPDLKSAVVVQASNKKEIFGYIYRIIFKLHTKYYNMTIYKEGDDIKILSQTESTLFESAIPSIRSFPNPSKTNNIVLNK